MNFSDISKAVKHLIKTSKCLHCENKHILKDINVVATTQQEGLFEVRCNKCKNSTIVTVLLAPEIEIKTQNNTREHKEISENDILDIKNFLNNFDGNFKKIFTNKK